MRELMPKTMKFLLGLVEDYTHQDIAPLVYCRGTFFAAPQPEKPT
jgi:hypothetical protein